MGLSIHRAHLRRNLAPMIPPSTTQGSDYRRFRELQEKGVWHKILQALLDWGDTLGKVKVEAVAVDSTRVEAKKGGKV